MGLALRRDMNYGAFADVEQVLAAHGLALAPMACGDGAVTVDGLTVLPTADVGDLERGAVAGLVLPAGAPDASAEATLDKLVVTAREKGLPVIAFGEGVGRAVRAIGEDPAPWRETPAVMIGGEAVTPLTSSEQLALVAATLG